MKREAEAILIERAKSGDDEAFAALLKMHAGMINRYVHRYGIGDIEDREQIAAMAMFGAVKRFDPSLGFSFVTFALSYVRGFLLRDRKSQMCHCRKVNHVAYSIDAKVASWNERSCLDILSANSSEKPSRESILMLGSALRKIDSRAAEVLRRRMNGDTLEMIGCGMGGITKERVRQIEKEGMAQVAACFNGADVLQEKNERRIERTRRPRGIRRERQSQRVAA